MQYADNRDLRARMYRAYATRASEFGDAAHDNAPLISRLLQLRAEEAAMLGYRNFAEVSLVPKMAESPEQVLGFLREMARKAKPFAEKDVAALRSFARDELKLDPLEPWDMAWVSEKLMQRNYAFSDQEVKQYFTEPKVLAGLFRVVETLFSVSIRPDSAPVWRVWLIPSEPLPLTGLGALRVWPITRGEGHARDVLAPLRQGQPADLGAMPLVDLTRFLACHLTDQTEDVSILFSTGLKMEGLPAERHAAILRWVIDSKDAFFRYLRLLLSELGDPFAAALAAQDGAGKGAWRAASDDAPILEEMVRAFCRGGDQLRAIERLIARLETGDGDDTDPIPAEFRALWNTFRIALATQDAAHAE